MIGDEAGKVSSTHFEWILCRINKSGLYPN